MYSDGFISKTSKYTNYFGLTIKATDKDLLEKFKTFLKSSANINYYTAHTSYGDCDVGKLLIGNNKIVSDLEKLGVVEHKTFKINGIPNIDYKDDFIRGIIDGDGSLAKASPQIQISGTLGLLTDIANYFNIKYSIRPDKTIYSLCYSVRPSRYLEKRLYKNASIYLNRKYNIAKRSFDSPITLEDVMIIPNIRGNPKVLFTKHQSNQNVA